MLLSGLFRLGCVDEAEAFSEWMRRTTAGRAEELQIMYGLGGERLLHEVELGHLDGYRGSRPVRVGNGAWDQFQLDVYGELLAAAWVFTRQRAESGPSSHPPFRVDFLREIVETVIRRWEEPDEGVWEVRGSRQHFVFSKLMAWVALDRGVRLFEGLLPARDLERWTAVRDDIRIRIETEDVDPDSGAFVQAFGSRSLDASVLQIPLLGFLPSTDPRVLATIDEIERRLSKNGHVYRYLDRKDGLPGGEGSFTFCTLWLVTSLALTGEIERAQRLFEKVLSHGSDLGLLAEEIDPDTGKQLGNFPQAFSHVGVIRAAIELDRARAGASHPIATPASLAEDYRKEE